MSTPIGPPDGTVKRRAITPEETEESIRYLEERFKTRTGDEAAELQRHIGQLKAQVAQMRAGTLRIWQRIPIRE